MSKVITDKVRFAYVNVENPKSFNGSTPKCGTTLIIDGSDKVTLDKIKKAIEEAKQEGLVKLGGKIPANLKTPIRDGNIDKPDDPAFANCYFVNANNKVRPGIVGPNLEPLQASDLYSGCYGRASIVFFAYNVNGNKGIGCSLQNLQKLEDGEPLGGKARAVDDFADSEDILG